MLSGTVDDWELRYFDPRSLKVLTAEALSILRAVGCMMMEFCVGVNAVYSGDVQFTEVSSEREEDYISDRGGCA